MSKLRMLCVDASIVVRLLVEPEDRVQALWQSWVEADLRLIAPSLLFYEVVNALYQYHKHGYFDDALLHDAVTAALALPIDVVGGGNIHRRAAALAAQMRLSAAYDAHYLALAETAGADLWTGDKRLASAARRHGLAWVHLLEK